MVTLYPVATQPNTKTACEGMLLKRESSMGVRIAAFMVFLGVLVLAYKLGRHGIKFHGYSTPAEQNNKEDTRVQQHRALQSFTDKRRYSDDRTVPFPKPNTKDTSPRGQIPVTRSEKLYLVTWYAFPHFINTRSPNKTFEPCKYKNCELSKKKQNLRHADAIIFKGQNIPATLPFTRPSGQVWIFYEHEAPVLFDKVGTNWKRPQYKSSFNWTMTYDRTNTDIYIPYGEFVKSSRREDHTDFLAMAHNKTKGGIVVTSHCQTASKRMEYIKILNTYIPIDIFGGCGKPFGCGKKFSHDHRCFTRVNDGYKFYLAFENAFCRSYRTEKLFENFQYDSLIITRGDMSAFMNDPNEATGAYISASDFKSAHELGKYLKSVHESPETYAKLLEEKSKYDWVSYGDMYQRALCEICERMNFQDKYRKVIPDLRSWVDVDNVCHGPTDL